MLHAANDAKRVIARP